MRGCNCPPGDCAGQVQRYLAGERAAGDELARKFTPLIQSIARRVRGIEALDTLDDDCQAAFLRIFARLKTWEGRCPFCDWLAVVATRRILDQAREARSSHVAAKLCDDIVDPQPPPPSAEAVECLARVIARLSPEWKTAYQMALDGQDRQTIADSLGKSVRTIQYWRAAIREQMEDCIER
jgi:RNA polymerase sigma factor (sigma-70 family)